MEYGGSTPFSTPSVAESPGRPPTPEGASRLAFDHRDLTQVVENGVEPPYSILLYPRPPLRSGGFHNRHCRSKIMTLQQVIRPAFPVFVTDVVRQATRLVVYLPFR